VLQLVSWQTKITEAYSQLSFHENYSSYFKALKGLHFTF